MRAASGVVDPRRRDRRRRAWAADNPGNIAIRAEVERALLSATDDALSGGEPVVDIGCGTGWWLERLALRGVEPGRLHGIDLSLERAEAARARAPGASVVCADARRLPWEDGTFAAAYLLLTLSSLESGDAVQEVLREARRVVRPGGAIAVWEPRVPTPWNPGTRWITRRAMRQELGREARSDVVTLLPPLARRLGKASEVLYPALRAGGALCTHRLVVSRPSAWAPRALIIVRNGVTHDARV